MLKIKKFNLKNIYVNIFLSKKHLTLQYQTNYKTKCCFLKCFLFENILK